MKMLSEDERRLLDDTVEEGATVVREYLEEVDRSDEGIDDLMDLIDKHMKHMIDPSLSNPSDEYFGSFLGRFDDVEVAEGAVLRQRKENRDRIVFKVDKFLKELLYKHDFEHVYGGWSLAENPELKKAFFKELNKFVADNPRYKTYFESLEA
jgi:hypothetical protein